MKAFSYQVFYNRIGAENGWDFNNVKCQTEGILWDFYEEVKKSSKPSDILLDIGTGGGERVLPLENLYLLVIGIDQSKGMIQTANENLKKSGAKNIRFFEMNEEKLLFPSSFLMLSPIAIARLLQLK